MPLAEYWYNTSYHSALGYSPFQVLYRHSPRHFGISNEVNYHCSELEQWLLERGLLEDVVRHHLHRPQQRMKHQANKHRSEREFVGGDLVYLKLLPCIQSSVAPRSNYKLSFRFYGPFKILDRIGSVAYRLKLPLDCQIHPIVHVSQLKKHIPTSVVLEDDINTVPVDPLKFCNLSVLLHHSWCRRVLL